MKLRLTWSKSLRNDLYLTLNREEYAQSDNIYTYDKFIIFTTTSMMCDFMPITAYDVSLPCADVISNAVMSTSPAGLRSGRLLFNAICNQCLYLNYSTRLYNELYDYKCPTYKFLQSSPRVESTSRSGRVGSKFLDRIFINLF